MPFACSSLIDNYPMFRLYPTQLAENQVFDTDDPLAYFYSFASSRTYFSVTRRFVCNHPHTPRVQHLIPDAESLPLLMINKANVSIYKTTYVEYLPSCGKMQYIHRILF